MIQIDMPMPKSCIDCPFKEQEYGEGECLADKENRCTYGDSSGRQEWCPLKEQEAVTIKKTKEHGFGVYGGICPKCHNWIQSAHSFCGFCGQAVKWV